MVQCCELKDWDFHLRSRAIMNNLHKKGFVAKEDHVWWRITEEGRERLKSLGVNL